MISLYYDDIIIRKKLLIKHGSLCFPNNGCFILKGENGVGKSLLLKNIFQNYKNSNYSFALEDQDNNHILKNESIIENISMSVDADKNNRIKNLIYQYGFEFLLTHDISKLSGGEKRILVLLRVLFAQEEILFLDEPTNDLDYEIAAKVIKMISDISKEKLIIVVSHDDRFKKIKKCELKIYDKTVVIDPESSNDYSLDLIEKKETNFKKECQVSFEKDEKFAKRNLMYNFFSLLLSTVFITILVFTMIDYKKDINPRSGAYIRENQVELYKENSISLGSKIYEEAFPLYSLYMFNEKNPINQIKFLSQMDLDSKRRSGITYDLNKCLNSNEYDVYPFEFYDTVNRKTVFVLDLYLQYYYDTTWDVTSIDSSDFFDLPYDITYVENPVVVKLEIDKLEYIINNIDIFFDDASSKYEIVSVIACFEGKIDYDKLIYDNYTEEEIVANGTIIRSQGVIECIDNIKTLNDSLDCLILILICFVILVLLDAVVLNLFLIINKSVIHIFKNYGYQKKKIIDSSIKKILFRYPKFVIVIGFAFFNYFYLSSNNIYLKGVFTLILMVYMSVTYSLSIKIITQKIDKFFRWDSR